MMHTQIKQERKQRGHDAPLAHARADLIEHDTVEAVDDLTIGENGLTRLSNHPEKSAKADLERGGRENVGRYGLEIGEVDLCQAL